VLRGIEDMDKSFSPSPRKSHMQKTVKKFFEKC